MSLGGPERTPCRTDDPRSLQTLAPGSQESVFKRRKSDVASLLIGPWEVHKVVAWSIQMPPLQPLHLKQRNRRPGIEARYKSATSVSEVTCRLTPRMIAAVTVGSLGTSTSSYAVDSYFRGPGLHSRRHAYTPS